MTDREKAIVMAYTGIAMLVGDKIDEFYKYLAELYGRSVYTHELVNLDIASKAKADFIKLCQDEQPELHWIPVTERLPEKEGNYIVTDDSGGVAWVEISQYIMQDDGEPYWDYVNVTAWMPMPEPYNESEEI